MLRVKTQNKEAFVCVAASAGVNEGIIRSREVHKPDADGLDDAKTCSCPEGLSQEPLDRF